MNHWEDANVGNTLSYSQMSLGITVCPPVSQMRKLSLREKQLSGHSWGERHPSGCQTNGGLSGMVTGCTPPRMRVFRMEDTSPLPSPSLP